jgi:integrase
MLMGNVEAYLTLQRAMGYKLTENESVLRVFARHLDGLGHAYVRADVALEWIRRNPSPRKRCDWLRIVRTFAIYLRLENPLHEVPPEGVFPFRRQRPRPFIYTADQIVRVVKLIGECHRPRWHGPTYSTLLGLIAATGMRVSEAVALRLDDVTADGLVVRETKFRKSRLLPLHESTQAVLDRYLVLRRGMAAATNHLFVTSRGTPVIKDLLQQKFKRIRHAAGLVQPRGKRNPRIHDLRHTFAVRALEKACFERDRVNEHILALSTYLGHARVTDTYWYLEATPELMVQISDRCEAHAEEGRL